MGYEYFVAQGNNATQISTLVNNQLESGWQLHGPLNVTCVPIGTDKKETFYQAMTREKHNQ